MALVTTPAFSQKQTSVRLVTAEARGAGILQLEKAVVAGLKVVILARPGSTWVVDYDDSGHVPLSLTIEWWLKTDPSAYLPALEIPLGLVTEAYVSPCTA